MHRLDIDQSHIDGLAAREFAADDLDLAPVHRRSRVALHDIVTPVIEGSYLRRNDHVRLWDWLDGVVVGPARHADFASVYAPEAPSTMGELLSVQLGAITDRAPVDPHELPMPVRPEVPAPPPREAGTVDIEALRLEVIKQVDVTSTALIRGGFEFEGVIFSMSNEAQIRYLAMQSDADYLPYPLPINSKDDSTFIVLRDAEHTVAFCRGAKAHVMGVVGSGHLQKRVVHGLQTAAELSAYVDPRAEAVHPALLAQTASDMAAGKTALGL